jgi:hypothetical protein
LDRKGIGDGREKKTAKRGASWFVLFAKYSQNDQVEEDEMEEAYSTNEGEKERV